VLWIEERCRYESEVGTEVREETLFDAVLGRLHYVNSLVDL